MMTLTNHKLLWFRVGSIFVSAFFAIIVAVDVNGYFMFPLFLLQLVSFLIASKLKYERKEKSLVSISRGGIVAIIIVYTCAIALGVTVSMTASRPMEAIGLLLIYVVILDALVAIPFVLSFTNYSEWQRVRYVPGAHSNHADSQMFKPYADSDLIANDSDTYWHQSPHYTAASIDSSPDVNPASGLIMIDDAIDVAGNFYGFNDHSFSNDISQTNQFSDYDYHNNN